MKLLSISKARSIWLFPLNDLNPRGKAITGDAMPGMITRYKFAKIPSPLDMQSAREKNEPIKFLGGEFEGKGGKVVVDFSAYNDGLIADTRSSTRDADLFLEDFLTWISSEFGLLSHHEIVQRKIYASELYITTERSLSLLNPKLEKLNQFISSKARGFNDVRMEVSSIGFWADQIAPTKPVNFRLERAEGIAFSENRYYSLAPLETEDHLAVLEEIDSLLSS